MSKSGSSGKRSTKKRKEEEGGEEEKRVVVTPEPVPRYEEDRNDDAGCAYDSTLAEGPEERYKDLCTTLPSEPEETYKDLCSASEDLTCLLGNLDKHIQENQNLRNVNAELRADPSPPSPNYEYLVSGVAEEARQLLETSSSVPQDDDDNDDEKGGLKKELAQKLGKKFEDIDSLRAEVIGKNEE